LKIIGLTEEASDAYIHKLGVIESNNNPKAKAKTSTASGRFQFIKGTWEGLGYKWADVFNDRLQFEAIERFTNDNAQGLLKAGCAINFATLYAAHFLGLAGALKVFRGQPSASINTVTTEGQRKANPSILGKGTVADFCDWLERKTGDDYRKRYADAPAPKPIPVEPAYPTPAPKKKGVNWVAILGLAAAIGVVVYFIFFRR